MGTIVCKAKGHLSVWSGVPLSFETVKTVDECIRIVGGLDINVVLRQKAFSITWLCRNVVTWCPRIRLRCGFSRNTMRQDCITNCTGTVPNWTVPNLLSSMKIVNVCTWFERILVNRPGRDVWKLSSHCRIDAPPLFAKTQRSNWGLHVTRTPNSVSCLGCVESSIPLAAASQWMALPSGSDAFAPRTTLVALQREGFMEREEARKGERTWSWMRIKGEGTRRIGMAMGIVRMRIETTFWQILLIGAPVRQAKVE